MIFVHFTDADGTEVAINPTAVVQLRIPSKKIWGDEANTVIGCTDGYSFAVKETLAEVETRIALANEQEGRP